MKISYSNVHAEFRMAVDAAAEHHIEKLSRFLKRYAPDLIQLHGSMERQPHKSAAFSFSVNLTLPTGTLHAVAEGADVRSSVNGAFTELEAQVKKHQQKLRKDYVWKRKRSRSAAAVTARVPAE
jgi:ribosomal subunit interface protein